MTKDQLLKLPLWQYTGEQFLELLDSHFVKTTTATENVTSDENVATQQSVGSFMESTDSANFSSAVRLPHTASRIVV